MPKKMTVISSLEEIPRFRSDAAASKFWDTHTYSSELLATSVRGPDPELAAILNRKPAPVKAVAAKKVPATKLRPVHQKKLIDLDSRVLDKLEAEAQKKGQSVSDLVNDTLKRVLKIA